LSPGHHGPNLLVREAVRGIIETIQIIGDKNEMPHDPAIKEFVWQSVEILRSKY
jgi:hypothetical protein